jgi:hypothetical protein
MTKGVGIILTGIVSLAHVGSVDTSAYSAPDSRVRVVVADSLRDIAVAVWDARHPTIYLNPTRMQRVGPLLAQFFVAHEYGHLYHHDTRSYALSADPETRDRLIQSRELQADCFAATTLGPSDRAAVEAAVQFFARLGPRRFDREHPSGAQRAAQLLACLPPPGTGVR